MAFGRKKRRQEDEAGAAPVSDASTAVGSAPAPEPTAADPAPATAVGDDIVDAATFAGDPAAAGTDAEGPGAEASGPEGSTHEVARAAGAPAAGDPSGAAEGDARAEGTA
ncbi:MAG: hypothetical protein H0U12_07390, partial [Thermoleophilaceae bacterium]|nr:hypothetical protein [Thermoleophilaceae bacterium]